MPVTAAARRPAWRQRHHEPATGQPTAQIRRCQACGYLPTAAGHRTMCGTVAVRDDPVHVPLAANSARIPVARPADQQLQKTAHEISTPGNAPQPTGRAELPVPHRPRRSPRHQAGWRDLARCAEVDPELYFVEKGESTRPAKRICRDCEVRSWCLQDALDHHEQFGVWGGLSERERRALARAPVPVRRCPDHQLVMSAGPAVYQCPAGHPVAATDLAQTPPQADAAA